MYRSITKAINPTNAPVAHRLPWYLSLYYTSNNRSIPQQPPLGVCDIFEYHSFYLVKMQLHR